MTTSKEQENAEIILSVLASQGANVGSTIPLSNIMFYLDENQFSISDFISGFEYGVREKWFVGDSNTLTEKVKLLPRGFEEMPRPGRSMSVPRQLVMA